MMRGWWASVVALLAVSGCDGGMSPSPLPVDAMEATSDADQVPDAPRDLAAQMVDGPVDARSPAVDTRAPLDVARDVTSYPSCPANTANKEACGMADPGGGNFREPTRDGYICRFCYPADRLGNPDLTRAQAWGCVPLASTQVVLCVHTCDECAF